ncbi:MAG: hypothetical protein WA125_02270 [Desulfosporosinus sp.]
MGLLKHTPENIKQHYCGGRNQEYRRINDVEYTFGNNGRSKERLHVVICRHHLMQIGRFINVLPAHSELLEKKVTVLGIARSNFVR